MGVDDLCYAICSCCSVCDVWLFLRKVLVSFYKLCFLLVSSWVQSPEKSSDSNSVH